MPHYMDKRHGVTLADAYAEAAASAPAHRSIIYTYELTHPSFESRICIVNAFEGITATTENGESVDFVACPVQVIPPPENDNAEAPSITVSIDGVSAAVAEQLESAAKTYDLIKITERIYVSDDLSAPAVLPPLSLTLQSVSITATRVTAQARFTDPINRGFPRKDYLPREYPGLTAR